MNKLTGYRTLIVNALLLLGGLVGLHVSPETIQAHLNIAFSVFAAANVFMRILTKGPVGKLFPETAHFADEIGAFVDYFHPEIDASAPAPAPAEGVLSARDQAFLDLIKSKLVDTKSDGSPASAQPPASTDPAPRPASDIAVLLPIYAAKAATVINEVLSETSLKAN